MKETCNTACQAAIHIIDKCVQNTTGCTGRDKIIIGKGCGYQTAEPFTQQHLPSIFAQTYQTVTLYAHTYDKAVIFLQITVKATGKLCDPGTEVRTFNDTVCAIAARLLREKVDCTLLAKKILDIKPDKDNFYISSY